MRALEAELQADPVRFFRGIVMPLLPRESRLALDHDAVVQWSSLLGANEEHSMPSAGKSGQEPPEGR